MVDDPIVTTPAGQPVPSPTERWAMEHPPGSDEWHEPTLAEAGGDQRIYKLMVADFRRKGRNDNEQMAVFWDAVDALLNGPDEVQEEAAKTADAILAQASPNLRAQIAEQQKRPDFLAHWKSTKALIAQGGPGGTGWSK